MSFLEELSKKGIIKKEQIGEIKDRAKEKFRGDIDEALMEFGVSEDQILTTRGAYLAMPVKKVNVKNLPFEIFKYIPEDSASHYRFIPIGLSEGVLEIGITDPENVGAMDALQFISAKLGMPFKVFLISKNDFIEIMNAYRGISSQVEEALSEFDEVAHENEGISEENLSKEIKKVQSTGEAKIVEDAPIIKIVAVILRNALEGNASDIHIEH
jgi:type II secretory ATPase GspE/PulE/Tfp pilus assembly ATPase PilB-like protein